MLIIIRYISLYLEFLISTEFSFCLKELKGIEELDTKWQIRDERLRRIAELREKGRRDYEAAIDFAEEKGIDTGKKEKSMEIAKKMITEGLELDFIEKMTGLDKETIQKVKEEF